MAIEALDPDLRLDLELRAFGVGPATYEFPLKKFSVQGQA